MEVADVVSCVSIALGCACLRSVTADEVDITLDIAHSLLLLQVKEEEYNGLVPFASIFRTMNLLCSNIAITRFTYKLPGPLHLFYLNCLIMAEDLQLFVEYESLHDATGDK